MAATPEQHAQLKQEYRSFYEALTLLLADYDPMGLVGGGAPYNEYDIEVDVILLRLNEAVSPDMLGQIMYEAFVQCFGRTFVRPDEQHSEQQKALFASIGNIAWHIWEYWKEEGRKQ